MKRIILMTALLAGFAAAPFAVGVNSASAAAPAGSLSAVHSNIHGADRHNPTATVHVRSFSGTQAMTVFSNKSPRCDLSKSGAAWLDACSPDGMAAGGSNFGSRR